MRSDPVVTVVRLLVDGEPVTGTWIVEQDWIDATSEFENDPDWVYVDSHGHHHRWMTGPDSDLPLTKPQQQDSTVPFLRFVVDTEPHWCELCDGDYQPGHYECVICGDEVTPGHRRFVERNYIPGPKHFTIDVDKVFQLGPVVVTRLADPAQTVAGVVVSHEVVRGVTGLKVESSRIVPTGPPVLAHG